MDQDRPGQVFRRLLSRLLVHRNRLAFIAAALLVHSLANLSIPWLCKQLFADAVKTQHFAAIPLALSLLLVVALVLAVSRFLADDQLGWVTLRVQEKFRVDLVAKLHRLPMRYHIRHRTGDIIARVFGDAQLLASFVYDAAFALGTDLLQALGAAAFLLYLNWELALLAGLAAPIALALVGLASKLVRRRLLELQQLQANMTNLLTDQLGAMPVILAFNAGPAEAARFGSAAREHAQFGYHTNRWNAGSRSFVNFCAIVGLVLVLGFGAGKVDPSPEPAPGKITLETLVGFALYAALLADPLTRLSRTHFEIQRSIAAGARLFELLDEPEENFDGAPIRQPVRGQVSLRHVRFGYDDDRIIFPDLNVTITAGETVALVGPSGAGKSTLTSLLLRFFRPQAGAVCVDDQDVAELSLVELRDQIGWVGQETFIVCGTVADNIRFGRASASLSEVEHAARLAGADEFIRRMPQGYETILGERGANLSGGQRARLAMARVVLKDPAIVIFDESTASLDSETETRLWRELQPWLARRTTMMIAHRFATITQAPRVIVLEHGHVVGDGSVAELQRTCPAFQRLFAEQMIRSNAA